MAERVSLVTDKNYYLNHHLKDVLDLCIKRQEHKWDNLIIIDGEERGGKSTLGKCSGYYVSYTTNTEFGLANVFFDIDELIEFALQNRRRIIIWDEAALGGMSSQHYEKVQQKLIQMLMVAGKYGHTYFFIIPSFFKLNWYLAVHRSLCLVHVYSPDMLQRGNFICLDKRQKAWVYNNNKKSGMYTKPTFSGQFTTKNTETILDESAYEAKKDAAILKYLVREDQEKDSFKVKKLKWFLANNLSLEKAQLFMNITRSTYFEWKKLDISMKSSPQSPIESFVLTQGKDTLPMPNQSNSTIYTPAEEADGQ